MTTFIVYNQFCHSLMCNNPCISGTRLVGIVLRCSPWSQHCTMIQALSYRLMHWSHLIPGVRVRGHCWYGGCSPCQGQGWSAGFCPAWRLQERHCICGKPEEEISREPDLCEFSLDLSCGHFGLLLVVITLVCVMLTCCIWHRCIHTQWGIQVRSCSSRLLDHVCTVHYITSMENLTLHNLYWEEPSLWLNLSIHNAMICL